MIFLCCGHDAVSSDLEERGYIFMYDNYNDRSVSLAHREAVKLAVEGGERFFEIAVSLLKPAESRRIGDFNVGTPCCHWKGRHYPKTVPVFKAGRTSDIGVPVARYLWMVRYGKVLPPEMVIYHLCGDRKCVAPDHLFAARSMAVMVGKLKADGRLKRCVRDGVLYRIWHESGNHGYVATPTEWGIDYETEPVQEHDFNVVEWAAGLLDVSASEVLQLMEARTERHRPRVDPMSEEYRLYKKHGAAIMAATESDAVGEVLLDMDAETLEEWSVATRVVATRAATPQDREGFIELSALCRRLHGKLADETTGTTTRQRLDRDGWPVVPDEGPSLELEDDVLMEESGVCS